MLNLGPLDGLNPLTLLGCDPTAEDDEFDVAGLVGGVCNGDDTNGSQADAPYNVRKALGLDVLPLLATWPRTSTGWRARTARTPSPWPRRPATMPSARTRTTRIARAGTMPDPDNGLPDGPGTSKSVRLVPPARTADGPDGSDGPSADTPDDSLAFTGADIGILGAIGLGVMAAGLALMALADRRRSALRS